jgi:hypothetical protein
MDAAHCSEPAYVLRRLTSCYLERKQSRRVRGSPLCDVVSSFLCHTLADCKMGNGEVIDQTGKKLPLRCTWWWKSFWTVISVPYLLSEVKVLQRNHLFQDHQGTGHSRHLQLRMPSSPFSQLLCIAVTAFHISNTLGHLWLQFLKQPRHPGKHAGSCQDLQWIKLIEISNTFTHSKRKRSTLPVVNAYEELLGQVWKRFLCIRCHRCDVTNVCVCVLHSRYKNQHRI